MKGFFKVFKAPGDEICVPASELGNCKFGNDYNGCGQCDDGFSQVLEEVKFLLPEKVAEDSVVADIYMCETG